MLVKEAVKDLEKQHWKVESLDDEWVLITDTMWVSKSNVLIGHTECINRGFVSTEGPSKWHGFVHEDTDHCLVCGTLVPEPYRMVLHLKGM